MVAKKGGKKFFRRHKAALVLLSAVALGVMISAFALSNLNLIVLRMAEARANQLAVEALNQAIYEVMGSSVTYGDLVRVSTDAYGQVTMLQANTLLMNRLASQATLTAQRNLRALADQGITLPLGAALGIDLFSGAGPNIRVNVVPVGSVTTRFKTAFESAGINQTRHEITLESAVLMRLVVPAGADSIEVNASVPIAESIIVGQVPDTFVNVPDPDSALNLLP